MFGWNFEINTWSRFWRWSLTKICVWTCDMTPIGYFGKMNSTLGSVVPLAMFFFKITEQFKWRLININSFVLFRGSIIESWMFQFLSDPCPIIVNLWHCWNQVEAKVFPKCYTDFSKLTHGFVKIVVWICQDCHMYFLPFAKPKQAEVCRFLQAVTWIDQNCYMYLVLSAKPNQAEVW